MEKPDFSDTSPIEMGRSLGQSLGTSVRVDDIPDRVKTYLQQGLISIDLDRYYEERVALAGFAIDYAIAISLGATSAARQMRKGYFEVWEHVARSGTKDAELYDIFISRCSSYAEAIKIRDGVEIIPGELVFDPVGLVFTQHLFGGKAQNSPLSTVAELTIIQFAAAEFSSNYLLVCELIKDGRFAERFPE